MAEKSTLDLEAAHKFFAADCFNRAWEILDKTERSPAEAEQMIRLAQASIWHWTQRTDCTDKNLSIGYWQLSRIYALLGEAENARKYAQLCLEITPACETFCRGFAYEALARAAFVGNQQEEAKQHLEQAWELVGTIADAEEKAILENDLKSLE